MTQNLLIADAIDIFGSQAALASEIECSQQLVSQMLNGADVSAEIAVRIDIATGGKVPRSALRPDLFAVALNRGRAEPIGVDDGIWRKVVVIPIEIDFRLRIYGNHGEVALQGERTARVSPQSEEG